MNKRRVVLGLGLVAAAGAAALAQFPAADSPAGLAVADRPVPSANPGPAAARFDSLPEREAIGRPKGELFAARSWVPPPAAAPKAPAAVAEKPAAPPFPYRIAGQVVEQDGIRVVLAKGDRIFELRKGETLEDGYRLEAIEPHALTFTYVPLGLKQQLAVGGAGLDLPAPQSVAAAAPPANTAQLRFEGPREVQAGKPFDVALKLTSPQPVRAMPMQLSFDAKRLEPLAVRPGELFAGGNFTYRVNPAGSIFVGASGSGRAASDTAFLVVTFRPIASGAAELKVSSLQLQGAAGRAIAHEPPQVFRAAIVQ